MKSVIKRAFLTWATLGALYAIGSAFEGNFELKNNSQAFDYCISHRNCYVVIVWPRGFGSLEYIVNTLERHASVQCVKTFALDRNEAFSLYRKLHKKMSYKSAQKYFKPYIAPSIHGKKYGCAALILQTDQPLETIVQWKKEIRTHIGESYYSMHINDFYDPQTIEAAFAVFKD